MFYRVFLIVALGAPRDHHSIFVETQSIGGDGQIFHVTGNIQNGMTFEQESRQRPEDSMDFIAKRFLGWVSSECLDVVGDVCQSIQAPKKQFDKSRRLYPKEPLRRCQEWTAEVIDALMLRGVVQVKQPNAADTMN